MSSLEIAFVRLVVSDVRRSEQFYRTVFELPEVKSFDSPDTFELLLKGGERVCLALFSWKDGRALELGTAQQIAFDVRDVDKVYERAMAAGGRSLYEPADYDGKVRVAFVADPDGHVIELLTWDRVLGDSTV